MGDGILSALIRRKMGLGDPAAFEDRRLRLAEAQMQHTQVMDFQLLQEMRQSNQAFQKKNLFEQIAILTQMRNKARTSQDEQKFNQQISGLEAALSGSSAQAAPALGDGFFSALIADQVKGAPASKGGGGGGLLRGLLGSIGNGEEGGRVPVKKDEKFQEISEALRSRGFDPSSLGRGPEPSFADDPSFGDTGFSEEEIQQIQKNRRARGVPEDKLFNQQFIRDNPPQPQQDPRGSQEPSPSSPPLEEEAAAAAGSGVSSRSQEQEQDTGPQVGEFGVLRKTPDGIRLVPTKEEKQDIANRFGSSVTTMTTAEYLEFKAGEEAVLNQDVAQNIDSMNTRLFNSTGFQIKTFAGEEEGDPSTTLVVDSDGDRATFQAANISSMNDFLEATPDIFAESPGQRRVAKDYILPFIQDGIRQMSEDGIIERHPSDSTKLVTNTFADIGRKGVTFTDISNLGANLERFSRDIGVAGGSDVVRPTLLQAVQQFSGFVEGETVEFRHAGIKRLDSLVITGSPISSTVADELIDTLPTLMRRSDSLDNMRATRFLILQLATKLNPQDQIAVQRATDARMRDALGEKRALGSTRVK